MAKNELDIPRFLKVKNRRKLPADRAARLNELVAKSMSDNRDAVSKFAELAARRREERLAALRVRVERARQKKRIPDRIARQMLRTDDGSIPVSRYDRVARELTTDEARKILEESWFLGEDGRYHPVIHRGVVRASVHAGRRRNPSAHKQESKMTAKTGKKKTTTVAKEATSETPREVGKPAKKVEDLRPLRAGTARAIVVEMASKSGGTTIAKINEEIKRDRQYVLTLLNCVNRDSGIGYRVEGEKVFTFFPGNRTIKDVIKEPAEAA